MTESNDQPKPNFFTKLLQNENFRWRCALAFVCAAILIPVCGTVIAFCYWSPIPCSAQPSVQPSIQFPNPLKGVLEILKLTLEISALVIGGTWAIQRFILSRPDEWSVNLSTETKQHLLDDKRCMLIVSVTIENVSAVRISVSSFETKVHEIEDATLKLVKPKQSRPSSDDKPGTPEIAYSRVKVIKHHLGGEQYLIEPNSKYVEEFAVIVKTSSVIQLFTEVKKYPKGLPINQRRFVVIKQKKLGNRKSQGGVAGGIQARPT